MNKINEELYSMSVGEGSVKIIKAGSGQRALSEGRGAVILNRVLKEGLAGRGS